MFLSSPHKEQGSSVTYLCHLPFFSLPIFLIAFFFFQLNPEILQNFKQIKGFSVKVENKWKASSAEPHHVWTAVITNFGFAKTKSVEKASYKAKLGDCEFFGIPLILWMDGVPSNHETMMAASKADVIHRQNLTNQEKCPRMSNLIITVIL